MLVQVEQAYKEKNPEATELPEYISKKRLDDEITKRKTAETNYTTAKKSLESVPQDWQDQLKNKDTEIENLKTSYASELEKVQKSSSIDLEIYKAKGRNVTAIRSLLDTEKDIHEELARIKASDPYLFGGTRQKGTGKEDDGEDTDEDALSEERMARAVGIHI